MVTARRPPSLGQYVERRLGMALGARGSLRRMLHRSLGADSFAGFWRYWNPIWGYYLSRYVDHPLRRVLPAGPAVVATFAISGAVHDAAVVAVTGSSSLLFVTWFTLLGIAVVVTSSLGVSHRGRPWAARATFNLTYMLTGLGGAMLVLRLIGVG